MNYVSGNGTKEGEGQFGSYPLKSSVLCLTFVIMAKVVRGMVKDMRGSTFYGSFLSVVLLLAAVLVIAGCSTSNGLNHLAPDSGNNTVNMGSSELGHLNFDFLHPPVKTISDATPGQADGSEFELGLPFLNVTADAPDAAYSGSLSYAIYALEQDVADDWLGVYLEYSSDPTGQDIWIGLSNYEKLRWDWVKTDDWYNMATFQTPYKYRSPAGITYVAIVGWNAEVYLRSITIDYTYGLGGGNISFPWGEQVGEITGRGKWPYETTVPAYSNAGNLHPTWVFTVAGHTSGYKWQCVEFCERFIWRIWNIDTPAMSSISAPGEGLPAGAWKWFYQPLLSGMTQHVNGSSTQPPAPGDVVVWNYKSKNNAGHVAVIKAVNLNEGWIACVQQNVYQGSYDGWYVVNLSQVGGSYKLTSTGWLSKYSILGWISYGSFSTEGQEAVAAPTGFHATGLTGAVRLDWDLRSDVDNYILARDGVPIQNLPGYYHYWEDPVSGMGLYNYTLVAQRSGQSSSPADTSGSPLAPPLSPPSNFVCTQGTIPDAVYMSWNAVSGAASYNIYADGNGNPKFTGITNTHITDTLANNGYGHSYHVKAVNGANISAESNVYWGWSGELPLATLSSDKQNGTAPVVVQFDASGSHDLDGTYGTGPITDFEWDFDGDGIYNESGSSPNEAASRGNSAPSVNFASAGTYNTAVRVTDDDGVQVISSIITISVNSDMHTVSGRVVLSDSTTTGLSGVYMSLSPGGANAMTESDGTFNIYNVANNTYSLTPNLFGWTFSPSARSVVVDNGSVVGQDFMASSPPDAHLTGDPTTGNAPLDVNFDASASNDPDNGGAPGAGILQYEWDFEADGTYDYNSGADATVTHSYTSAGNYTCRVRVTDNESSTDFVEFSVSVDAPLPSWHVFTPDASVMTSDTSLAIVDGFPAIAYDGGEATYFRLRYVRALDPDGLSWGTPQVVDGAGNDNVGKSPSLAVINGKPAISYFAGAQYPGPVRGVKYIHALDIDGSTWNTPVLLDSSFDGSGSASTSMIARASGEPAIAYSHEANSTKDLRYIHATDLDGTSWETVVYVETVGDTGFYPSMALVSCIPAISYRDATNQCLKYVRASNGAGTAWGSPIVIDNAGNAGYYSDLTDLGNFPMISYVRGSDQSLCFVRANDDAGSTWHSPKLLVSNINADTSINVLSSNPVIAYCNANSTDLQYISATESNGDGSWNSDETIDSAVAGNWCPSLAIVNGKPAVSYTSKSGGSNNYLKYAIYY